MSAAHTERLYFHLQLAAGRLRAEADRACLDAAGVTTAQAAALAVVAGRPGTTQKEVARALHQAESAVTTLVRRLLAADLVTRTPSAADGRAWALDLTPTGRRALAQVEVAFGAVNDRIDAVLDPDEVASLAARLRLLAGT
ncbi:MarR family transcriptional regulator [Iamia sp. SCSIO 61187]|uniref:MarR family winged helix-turn-helix transcriptional regulator n=1 Tax=Iamia sp. SCSIO 61187 TaxID=2722752 RepID=UPI001C63ACA8|nr:MarR family transcriptional regulator [Iamia sp. SCSIO 61187]QYG94985.1 MarR family transcriptional regulator [Iamia sp. SCSIO 61187]